MADLDAMLDDAAEETIPTVFDIDAELKSTKKIDDVKPWLAFSSNVPPAIRDKWSKMVKTDALSNVKVSSKSVSYWAYVPELVSVHYLTTESNFGAYFYVLPTYHYSLSNIFCSFLINDANNRHEML